MKDILEMGVDIISSGAISKINSVTWQKENDFLKMKKSISAPETLGYYPPQYGCGITHRGFPIDGRIVFDHMRSFPEGGGRLFARKPFMYRITMLHY